MPRHLLQRVARQYLIKVAAKIGTDTSTIYAIAPEALYRIVRESHWEAFAAGLWGPGGHSDTNTEVTWDAMNQVIRQHGGAVFTTGHDGDFDVKVPGATSEGGCLPPYGTPEYGTVQRVARAFAHRFGKRLVARLKTAGWWAAHPETGQMVHPPVDKGGLMNAIPGVDPNEGQMYVGDEPADIMDGALDEVDLAYRREWGRPASPAELQAVWAFCSRKVVQTQSWKLNEWVDDAARILGTSQTDVASLPRASLDTLLEGWREYKNSGSQMGKPYRQFPEPTPEARAEWEALVIAFAPHRMQPVLVKKVADRVIRRMALQGPRGQAWEGPGHIHGT